MQYNRSNDAVNVSKLKKKKKLEATTINNNNNKNITQTTAEEFEDNQDKDKDHSNIEIIPKKSGETDDEKTAIKRNPKDDVQRYEENESDKDDIETTHKRPFLRKPKMKPKLFNSPDTLGESKPGKPAILPRKLLGNNPCTTPTIKKQLDGVKERITKIIERMDQANFNCATLNTEIDLVRTSLQQILNKIPEAPKHREANRAKFLDNIRERHAKIHARFGKLEMIKPNKSVLVGNKEPVTPSRSDDTKMIDVNSKIVLEPTNL